MVLMQLLGCMTFYLRIMFSMRKRISTSEQNMAVRQREVGSVEDQFWFYVIWLSIFFWVWESNLPFTQSRWLWASQGPYGKTNVQWKKNKADLNDWGAILLKFPNAKWTTVVTVITIHQTGHSYQSNKLEIQSQTTCFFRHWTILIFFSQ